MRLVWKIDLCLFVVKELKIECSSLQSMIQDKNQQLSQHFANMEDKDAEIKKLRQVNFSIGLN